MNDTPAQNSVSAQPTQSPRPRLSFRGAGIVAAVTVGAYILMAVVSIGQSDPNSEDRFWMPIGAAIGLPIVAAGAFLLGLIAAKVWQIARVANPARWTIILGLLLSLSLMSVAFWDIISDTWQPGITGNSQQKNVNLNCGRGTYLTECKSGPCCCANGTICDWKYPK